MQAIAAARQGTRIAVITSFEQSSMLFQHALPSLDQSALARTGNASWPGFLAVCGLFTQACACRPRCCPRCANVRQQHTEHMLAAAPATACALRVPSDETTRGGGCCRASIVLGCGARPTTDDSSKPHSNASLGLVLRSGSKYICWRRRRSITGHEGFDFSLSMTRALPAVAVVRCDRAQARDTAFQDALLLFWGASKVTLVPAQSV